MEAGRSEDPQVAEQRAFQALSFEEEKHAIIAEVHRTTALQRRLQHLRSNDGSSDQIQETTDKCAQAGEELRQNVMGASRSVWAHWEIVEVVLSIPELRRDCAIAGQVLETWLGAWKLFDSSLFSDRSMMLKVIKRHGWWLRYAGQQLQDDREVVMAAVASDAQALRFASAGLQDDKAVVLAAASGNLGRDPRSIQDLFLNFASAKLQNDKEVVLAAVAHHAANVMHAGTELQGDREVALAALRSRRKALGVVLESLSQQLRSDREVMLEAIGLACCAIRYAGPELREDQDFILQAMRGVVCTCGELAIYQQAAETLRRLRSYQEFHDAARSALAIRGEHAPVVTVTLELGQDCQQQQAESSKTRSPSFEATLLSGVSFQCSFPEEQGQKQPKTADSEEESSKQTGGHTQAGPTIGELAELVQENLPKYMQADPLPSHVFLVISKLGDSESVAVTPRDWARPLTDFF